VFLSVVAAAAATTAVLKTDAAYPNGWIEAQRLDRSPDALDQGQVLFIDLAGHEAVELRRGVGLGRGDEDLDDIRAVQDQNVRHDFERAAHHVIDAHRR